MLKNNQNKNLVLIQDLGYKFPNENSKQKSRYALYKCFCGKEFKAIVKNVKAGSTQSCGCTKITHNLHRHRLYSVWSNMIQRCTNPEIKDYKNYGERGITVCNEWLNIETFIKDMYPTYKDGLSIDRINVNGNYEKSNCRWTSKEIQARNTRKIMTTNTSGYRGASWHKRDKKWMATICIDNKKIYLGYFDTSIKAAKAYDKYIEDNNLEHTKNFS